MVERRPALGVLAHAILLLGVLVVAFPLYIAFVASTHTAEEIVQVPMPMLPGPHLIENYHDALVGGGKGAGSTASVGRMMFVSLVTALVIAFGKIAISLLSAFAIVYFRFPFRTFFFWAIFITLMLPVEVRILPTYKVIADLHMLNSFAGLTVPLIASATATFLFRQFFLTVPEELCDAARVDGARPMQFFWMVLLPLSRTNIVAMAIILFLWAWNQYLWPLLITTDKAMATTVIGLRQLMPSADAAPSWHVLMAGTLMTMAPPLVVVLVAQRWFVKGLIDSGK